MYLILYGSKRCGIPSLASHLANVHGTLVFRGTPVENH
jgi:hypothetical protein